MYVIANQYMLDGEFLEGKINLVSGNNTNFEGRCHSVHSRIRDSKRASFDSIAFCRVILGLLITTSQSVSSV